MATQHSTQKQKTITITCDQPGSAVVRVSPSTAKIVMEIDTLGDAELNEMLRLLHHLKTGGKLPEFLATWGTHLAERAA